MVKQKLHFLKVQVYYANNTELEWGMESLKDTLVFWTLTSQATVAETSLP